MKRTKFLQEVRKMRFKQAYEGWREGRLSQQHKAVQLFGVCERSFQRYCARFEQEGLDGLIDRRLAQVSHGASHAFGFSRLRASPYAD